jgi:hypothetical protein
MRRASGVCRAALLLMLTAAACSCSGVITPNYSIECTLEVRFDANTTVSQSGTIQPSEGASETVSVPPYEMTMSIGTSNLGVMELRVELFEEAVDGSLNSLGLSIVGGLSPDADFVPGDLVLGSSPVWADGHQLTPTCLVAG